MIRKEGIESNGTTLKMREVEAFYNALAKDLEELICRYRPDGTLAFVNDSYCRYFGKSYEQLVGHNLTPLIPEEDRKLLDKRMNDLCKENPITVAEHRVIMPNGEIRWLHWLIHMVFDDDGRFVGYQSKGRDVTKRKMKNNRNLKVHSKTSNRIEI